MRHCCWRYETVNTVSQSHANFDHRFTGYHQMNPDVQQQYWHNGISDRGKPADLFTVFSLRLQRRLLISTANVNSCQRRIGQRMIKDVADPPTEALCHYLCAAAVQWITETKHSRIWIRRCFCCRYIIVAVGKDVCCKWRRRKKSR